MSKLIPDSHLDLFRKKAFGHLATLNEDGSPQVTPVWVEYDGKHVVINSSKGRKKDLNMRREKRVALSIQDPDNAYRYLEVRGRVVEVAEEGGVNHLDKLAKKYLDKDKYPWLQPGEVRVVYKIAPERFSSMG
ncbi:MAG: PPOX class F420-dependent oxidoreductase [Candidatus Tectomicrobia bacterium]|nr:PPOX class F420-dependent oxidoreductase [Candidatus Tectomicrobia bacterium]